MIKAFKGRDGSDFLILKKCKIVSICVEGKKTISLILLSLVIVVNPCWAAEEDISSRYEILDLLPRSIDMADPVEQANFQKLIALGPTIHGILGEELLSEVDWITASEIIAIYTESRGDKTVALDYLKRFLALPKDPSSREWNLIRGDAMSAVSEFSEVDSRMPSSGEDDTANVGGRPLCP